jgi:hypothetical protein
VFLSGTISSKDDCAFSKSFPPGRRSCKLPAAGSWSAPAVDFQLPVFISGEAGHGGLMLDGATASGLAFGCREQAVESFHEGRCQTLLPAGQNAFQDHYFLRRLF